MFVRQSYRDWGLIDRILSDLFISLAVMLKKTNKTDIINIKYE
jgi:hypothetical protein